MRWRVGDLPACVVACIGEADRKALGLGPARAEAPDAAEPRDAAARGPNKTEARYRDERLRGRDARYEALTFRLANGHRYTPDWVVLGADGRIECHEVKGAFKLGSHGRARLAFDQARTEFPGVRWVWAEWTGRKWEVGSRKWEVRSGETETSMDMDGQDRAAERGLG